MRSFGKSIPKRSALFVLVSLERAKRDSRGTRAPLWREGRGEVDLSAVGVQRARLDLWGVWYLTREQRLGAGQPRCERGGETTAPQVKPSSKARTGREPKRSPRFRGRRRGNRHGRSKDRRAGHKQHSGHINSAAGGGSRARLPLVGGGE